MERSAISQNKKGSVTARNRLRRALEVYAKTRLFSTCFSLGLVERATDNFKPKTLLTTINQTNAVIYFVVKNTAFSGQTSLMAVCFCYIVNANKTCAIKSNKKEEI